MHVTCTSGTCQAAILSVWTKCELQRGRVSSEEDGLRSHDRSAATRRTNETKKENEENLKIRRSRGNKPCDCDKHVQNGEMSEGLEQSGGEAGANPLNHS